MRSVMRTTVAAAAVAALSGCGTGLGGVGEVLGGVLGGGAGQQGQGQLVVEIQQVDTRQQAIHVRTQEGRTGAVRYDRNTQVVYRQQQYPVTALERGDVATLEVQQLQNNEMYVSRVVVQQSVQERTGQATQQGAAGELHRLSGRVGQVNPQAGMFELQTPSGTLTVALPANASAAAVNRFRSLRSGDSVTVEGSFVTAEMVELYRFL